MSKKVYTVFRARLTWDKSLVEADSAAEAKDLVERGKIREAAMDVQPDHDAKLDQDGDVTVIES